MKKKDLRNIEKLLLEYSVSSYLCADTVITVINFAVNTNAGNKRYIKIKDILKTAGYHVIERFMIGDGNCFLSKLKD